MPASLTISGMTGGTYFADSPIVIQFRNIQWPNSATMRIIRVAVTVQWPVDDWSQELQQELPASDVYNFQVETAAMTSYDLDIRSAFQAFLFGYDYSREIAAAEAALQAAPATPVHFHRPPVMGTLAVSQSYMSGGSRQTVNYGGSIDPMYVFSGRWTELERLVRAAAGDYSIAADIDPATGYVTASTKPEGVEFIGEGSLAAVSRFAAAQTVLADAGETAPLLDTALLTPSCQQTSIYGRSFLRDGSRDYADLLFVNSRGAIESCSAMALEELKIDRTVKHYHQLPIASFAPTRHLLTLAGGGQRSWEMSSGYVSREWAEWWTREVLGATRCWLRATLPNGGGTAYLPVTIDPAKKQATIYNREKPGLAHVDFTVTLALEG